MPELPEVETVRRSLVPHLIGRRIETIEARAVRLREGIEPRQWRRLEGVAIEALERRGKYLVAHAPGAAALFHLGMSGRLVLARPPQPRAPHTHLVLRLEGGLELRLVDPRRFGVAVVLAPGALARHPGLAALGADPLGPDAGRALAEGGRSRAPIRSVLLDQRVLAGLGNIYANEALALAGISPLRRADRISPRRVAALAAAVRQVLEAAIEAGGTTLADGGFVDAAGDGGYFAVRLAVYGREGEPCGRCGGLIARRVLAGRSAFYCPRCQR